MTILSLPVLSRKNATSCTFSLVANTQTFESPLNKSVQTYELPGARWTFSATWQNLTEGDARVLKAWLLKLRGQAGRFYAYDLSHKTVAGQAVYGGDGTVYGAGQVGRSLVTLWSPPAITADSTLYTADETITIDQTYYSSVHWLLPGDYFNVNGELKMITDVIPLTPTSNLATITFEPPMRVAPADGAVVTITAPKAVFRLKDDKQDNFTFDPERKPSITISGEEVFQ